MNADLFIAVYGIIMDKSKVNFNFVPSHTCLRIAPNLSYNTVSSQSIQFISKLSMFSGLSAPGAFFSPPLILPTPDSQKLVNAIRDQTEGTPPHLVYVIDIVSVRFGGFFTTDIRQQLEKFRFLQMLTLNDCGIQSLYNFPHLPSLIRLDMVFNSIPGQDLQYLQPLKHLQTLMLGANKIQKIQHLLPLKQARNLLQLDLLNNEIVKVPGYRAQVFSIFPSLSILDTLDKIGKDAYNNSNMLEAVSRIPDTLFDKSPPPPPAPIHVAVHEKQKKKLKSALARTGSLDSIKAAPKVPGARTGPVARTAAGKLGKAKLGVKGGRSRSARAGLVFPVGRIHRKLKEIMIGHKVSSGCAIYLAGILEYLSAELLQISGNDSKNNHKKRITPQAIKQALKGDDEMNRLLNNVIIRQL